MPVSVQCLGDNSSLAAEDVSETQPFVIGSAGMITDPEIQPEERLAQKQKNE